MEFEEIIKFVWGAIILVVFVVSRFKVNKRAEQQEQKGRQMPFDLEQLFGDVSPKTKTPKAEIKVTPEPQHHKVKSPISIIDIEDEIPQKKGHKSLEFNLRKAVIMAEILTPKFKNE